jgi:hypothetical protein
MPSPSLTFEGLAMNDSCIGGLCGSGWPPDPNGDVGANHYIETVNTSVGIFNKSGTLIAAYTYNAFFSGTGTPCDDNNIGDPIVVYDVSADRWIFSDFAWGNVDNGPYYECIAVSRTNDPVNGGWYLYAMLADPNYLNDYPKLAVWSDGIYMSANLFDLFNNGYNGTSEGVRVWALNKQELYNGLTLNPVHFDLSTAYANLLPSNARGAVPSGRPDFFASVSGSNTLQVWKFHVDWVTPLNSTFTGPTNLTVASFVMPCNAANIVACVPQLNGESVDGLGDRLMFGLQYRQYSNGTEALWVNHTVAASSAVGYPTGIRWYEIRDPNGSATVYQQGTYQPDSNYRWMGSIAADRDGNAALGFSISSASMYPAIRYTGRLRNDPLGLMPQGETTIIQGTGSQSGGYNRWGDYSAMTLDPDGCTFWYTNEYYATTGQYWRTRIGSFKFPGCDYRYYFPIIFNSYPP